MGRKQQKQQRKQNRPASAASSSSSRQIRRPTTHQKLLRTALHHHSLSSPSKKKSSLSEEDKSTRNCRRHRSCKEEDKDFCRQQNSLRERLQNEQQKHRQRDEPTQQCRRTLQLHPPRFYASDSDKPISVLYKDTLKDVQGMVVSHVTSTNTSSDGDDKARTMLNSANYSSILQSTARSSKAFPEPQSLSSDNNPWFVLQQGEDDENDDEDDDDAAQDKVTNKSKDKASSIPMRTICLAPPTFAVSPQGTHLSSLWKNKLAEEVDGDDDDDVDPDL